MSSPTAYASRPTMRRTRSEMDGIRAAIVAVLGEIQPATVSRIAGAMEADV